MLRTSEGASATIVAVTSLERLADHRATTFGAPNVPCQRVRRLPVAHPEPFGIGETLLDALPKSGKDDRLRGAYVFNPFGLRPLRDLSTAAAGLGVADGRSTCSSVESPTSIGGILEKMMH